MTEQDIKELIVRGEKTAFMIGTTIGQMSNLLNQIKTTDIDKDGIYKELRDIWKQAALLINAIYYKEDFQKAVKEAFAERRQSHAQDL
jgi:hypothetical protein